MPDVSYKKLFKLMIDQEMKKKDLQSLTGLSSASITKLSKNEHVNMEVLVRICKALNVNIGDIVDINPLPEEAHLTQDAD